jgi:multidrug resistance protein MdtO
MATLAQTAAGQPRIFRQLWEFLKEELAPYPGRADSVARLVTAATLVAVICLIFWIHYESQGAIFAFVVSRESPRSTMTSSLTILWRDLYWRASIFCGTWARSS